MIKVLFEWDGDRFGATFKTRKEVDGAWLWLVSRYPGARIVDIKIAPQEVLPINLCREARSALEGGVKRASFARGLLSEANKT